METENDEGDTTTSSSSQPGGLLTTLKDVEEQLYDSEFVENCSDNEQNMEEEDKENELRTCGESNESPIAKEKMLEYSKGKREEEEESNSFQKLKCSPTRQLQKQSVLTSHSSNILDTPNANAEKSCEQGLSKLFGYRRSMKTRKRDDQTSESLRQKTETEHGIAVQSIEVIDIDSGYLSDTEMSTDGDTPTPTQSGALRVNPPSFGANVPRMQGSAAGTKV